uniref:Dynein regulatory complex subunit 4 n=1 Tax=Cyclopterus lumpus TaxID=8103 RepID=A0A8C3B2D0_CYCLU
QPPKSKGSSKKPAKVKTPTLIDGFTKEELSKEQMEEHIVRLREELDREKEERNYFQLERDKIHTFWEITDSKLEEVKAEKKNFDTDIEEDEGRHQVEVKVYKQKMKHLLCEHQNTISELKADGLVHTQAVQEEQNKLETVLHKDMRAVMVDMQELDNENLVKELELKHREEMTKTSDIFEKQISVEVQAKYEKKMELLVQELDNIMKNVTCEIEDQWNSHINTLIEDHKKAFMEVDALFIGMKQDLDMNESLKAQKEGMHTKQKEKDLVCLLQENKYLTELLSKVKEENADIERKMKYFDVIEKVKQKKLDELKCDYKTLEQKLCKVLLHLERDELEKTFTQNIQQVQDEGDWKSMQLERRLEGLIDSLEKTQAQLLSVLSASNMDQTALQGVTNKIETNLDSSNYSIKNLEYKKAQLSQARKDLLLTYEAKQRALGACGGALFKAI